jgi:RHS repeat-associated protein
VDGDGLADIVYVDDRSVTVWVNRSGNGWSAPIQIHGTPRVTDMDAVRLVDLRGSGVSGVLWSADADGTVRHHMHFLDLTGGGKPYLLNAIDNHLGAETMVEYASSTDAFLADDARPSTRWRTSLPFPVQVVKRVEVVDRLSQTKLTTEYRYHHGHWDGAEREFRGFGMVEQLDSEALLEFNAAGMHGTGAAYRVNDEAFSPPVLKKTWFHQGPIGPEHGEWRDSDHTADCWAGDPGRFEGHIVVTSVSRDSPDGRRVMRDAVRALRGMELRTELYMLDGSAREPRPYTVTETRYGVRDVEPPPSGQARRRVFFPHRLDQRVTHWERGDDPMTQVTLVDDYDDFGQPREETSVALPRRSTARGPAPGTPGPDEARVLATYARRDYASPGDPVVYLHDRECQARTFELREPRLVQEQAADDVVRVIDDQVAAAMGLRAAFRAALGGWSAGQPLPGAVRLVQHTINYYDGAAFEGLGAGVVGHYGALTRRETLVLTDELLDASYGGRRPVYLGGTAEAPAGAPAGFGHDAGYRRRSNSGAGHHAGYYADTLRRRYDFQSSPAGGGRGLAEAERNPLGHTSTIGFDDFQWLPVSVVDAVRLETRARQNYRTFQPASIVDPNRNVVEVEYSPLGLAAATWIKGKPEEIEGDRERPSTRYEYDFRAFERSGRPIAVRTIRHVHHDTDARAESSARDDVIETREFSDGFGRLIQVRSQAEDVTFGDSVFGHGVVALVPDERADRAPVIGTRNGDAAAPTVVVGGWQRYDNKGRVIETFEPYFDRAWDYAPPTADQVGRSVRVRYDPRGRAVCTVNPDGSLQRVIFGAPRDARNLALSESDLASVDVPASFVPTPWEAYTYDANDLASVSRDPNGHTLAGRAPVHHRFTPDSTLMDGLGRVVRRVARSGSDAAGWLTTRMAYDTRGNLVDVHDPLGRRAFAYAYDLLDRPLAVVAIDAGTRTSVPDAAGNVIETRDGRGGVVLRQYDPANRLVRLWARNDAAAALTLRGHVAYGDDGDRDAARERNALGRPVEHRDEAGVQRFVRYDFKRQLTDKVRQTIGDSALADGWQPDWSAQDADQRLDPREYQTSTRYDALSRIVELTCPADAGGIRRGVTPAYNRAGALERVSAGGEVYVDRIAYNARGQRTLVLYSNGLMTRYAYDARTFRLARLRTERFSASQDLEYRPDGGVLQDLAHAYDLAGNIIAITDRTPGSGVRGHVESDVTDTALRALLAEGDALVRRFDYDPLYRLVRATGREAINIASPRPPADDARNGFNSGNHGTPNQDNAPNLTAAYWESYAYDPAGNLVELKHGSPRAPTWSRHFGVGGRTPGQWAAEWPARLNASATWPDAPGNRLTHVGDDTVDAPQTHYFDDGGHLTREHTERRLSWDHAGQLIGFTVQPRGSTTASIRARYLYGADGMRVKKWVRRGGGRDESIVYIDGVFEHHRWSHGQAQGENTHLHVMDRQSRVAVIRVGDRHPDDGGEPVQYHFGDHLGSSALVVGGAGAASRTFVSREEYLPYGETSFGCFGRKRYRFSARERDEESGFLYCGARYLVPWLNRWASCDPAGPADHLNAYTYARCSPLVLVDPHGRQAGPPPDQEIVFEEVNIVGTSMDVPEALRARREAARLGWSDYEQMYDQEFHRLWDEQRRQEDMEQLKVYGAITGIVAAGALGGELVGAGALGVATALELGSLSTGILVGASSGAATVASTDLAEMGFGRDITPATFGTEVLAGAIFGGILGGVLGAVLGGRRPALPPAEASPRSFRLPGDRVGSFMRVGEGFDIQVKGPEGLSRFRSSFAHMEGSELVVEHAEIVLGKPHAVGARSLMQMRDAIGRQLADIYGADSVLFTPTARTGSGATRAGAALRQSDAARWTRESGRFSRVKE